MNSVEISTALMADKKLKELFVGVFPADFLPEKEYPGYYIANTDSSSGKGAHWVAFHTPRPGIIEAFDSYGRNPAVYSEHIKRWMGNDYVIMSGIARQGRSSTTCGQHCMFFILLRCHGYSYKDILSALNENPAVNDKFVCKFVNRYFGLATVTHNSEFLIQALLKGIKELKI
jgi:hypothetical protein